MKHSVSFTDDPRPVPATGITVRALVILLGAMALLPAWGDDGAMDRVPRRLDVVTQARAAGATRSRSAPHQAMPVLVDQIVAAANTQYRGDGLAVLAAPDGARLRSAFQELEAEATRDGLWITSTKEADGGRFRLIADIMRRNDRATFLPGCGVVTIADTAVRFSRPGLTEEYTTSVDGVRQDFVIDTRPTGGGELRVELALSGARAEPSAGGAMLTLDRSDRALVYNGLRVTDSSGRELAATLEVVSAERLAIRVDDSRAGYPVRIDPTFSDSNVAARSVYFGAGWRGGESSEGSTPSTTWLYAEGPTGPFFDTFLLMANPGATPATVTVTYYSETGGPVTRVKTIAPNSRITVHVDEEDPAVANTTVWMRVTSDVPIAAERAVFWPGEAGTWVEAHGGTGAQEAATHWALAEGAVGGPLNFQTFVLLANPSATDAQVQVTYLRENGTTVIKTYAVGALQRRVVHINGLVPELKDEGVAIDIRSTNNVPIVVERSIY